MHRGVKIDPNELELEERVVKINRVSKVVKGGKRFSFTALVVVGNKEGIVGVGLGKASEVPEAIRKGFEKAKRELVSIPLTGTTIPHELDAHFGAAHIMMKPAAPGTGVIAGAAVRAVVELAGVKDILTKSLGSDNQINIVYAILDGLKSLRRIEEVAKLRGKTVEELLA